MKKMYRNKRSLKQGTFILVLAKILQSTCFLLIKRTLITLRLKKVQLKLMNMKKVLAFIYLMEFTLIPFHTLQPKIRKLQGYVYTIYNAL